MLKQILYSLGFCVDVGTVMNLVMLLQVLFRILCYEFSYVDVDAGIVMNLELCKSGCSF